MSPNRGAYGWQEAHERRNQMLDAAREEIARVREELVRQQRFERDTGVIDLIEINGVWQERPR